MRLPEIQTIENTLDDINRQIPDKAESITSVGRDNKINDPDLSYKRLLYGLALVILAAFLFVAAIYYGVINP
ncbi:conserved hypothetical protein [Trichormus variabilis ATCC 29413]|uniref:Uncharacterized protein n=2 Tax=Anabaena variabilis TaxID=264691 RepID=Q3MA05_TRIV2|nr:MULTISPECIES: hypothetical protein [Nostocaceae]ABA22181.1 conserved hypothetical protein [Trichormus variabilis ATCC 29413]MBC1217759.1 hypothetical protein [Trichormus variabilis ARAD]MBC1259010.1 hypothetical protein [Trichormus variabilis V5]MBC1269208.1 hypothetical protein [Trichormus variabilis FSR]MBC1302721.1 hypothetical protein [Trichormus variabilis N2B]